MSLRIVLASADAALRDELSLQLGQRGDEFFCARDAAAARDLVALVAPEICLWDLAADGLRACAALPAAQDACWVKLGSLEPGFDEALPTPVGDEDLAGLLTRAKRTARLRRERRLLRRQVEHAAEDRPIVCASGEMIELLESLEAAADVQASVLLEGETGTGKEAIARTIHGQSPRRLSPFVRVGARDADPARVGEALFGALGGPPGHLVDAEGGTLYLDDVDALAPDHQERLLETLEREEVIPLGGDKPRTIGVRVIAATPKHLAASVGAGEFRGSLHARLAGVSLRVPPLRERREDIPLLLDHFVARCAARLGRPTRSLSAEALAQLVDYSWPGNVRELANLTERAVLLSRGSQIGPEDLPDLLEPGDAHLGLRRARKQMEADLIRRALRRTGGNRTHAARLLEISHRALLYKLKEYGIRD